MRLLTADFISPTQLWHQDPASVNAHLLIELHHFVMFYLVLILMVVLVVLLGAVRATGPILLRPTSPRALLELGDRLYQRASHLPYQLIKRLSKGELIAALYGFLSTLTLLRKLWSQPKIIFLLPLMQHFRSQVYLFALLHLYSLLRFDCVRNWDGEVRYETYRTLLTSQHLYQYDLVKIGAFIDHCHEVNEKVMVPGGSNDVPLEIHDFMINEQVMHALNSIRFANPELNMFTLAHRPTETVHEQL